MEPLTLFTWGYWGWGSATDKLIEAVGAVEKARGYAPPMFVDIRLSRSVRAVGFNGAAFEKAVGSERYRWLPSLGNLAIKEGGAMRIKDPAAAATLVEIAQTGHAKRQRVLFFCSCEFPGVEGNGCHRATVAGLVLRAAESQGVDVEIVEWPGGEPRSDLKFEVPRIEMDKIGRGAMSSMSLGEPVPLDEMAAIPWFSEILIGEEGNEEAPPFLALTGPARYKETGWYLPFYEQLGGRDMSDEKRLAYARGLREEHGFAPRRTSSPQA